MTTAPPGACDCHAHVFGPYDRYPLAADRPYTPPEAGLGELRAMHAELGVQRVVIVAASPYGTDDAALLDAVARLGDDGRGVVALDPGATDADLRHLDALGVRGVRINLASVGASDPAAAEARLRETAARVAPLGWHVDLHAGLDVVAALAGAIAAAPAPTVVDHFGLADPAAGAGQPGFAVLRDLAAAGHAYVKLSAPERLGGDPDGDAVAALARALLDAAPDRLLWASDWPHTGGGPHGGGARDPSTVEPFRDVDDARSLARLREWAGDDGLARRVLVENPARLYGFRGAGG
jgi:predicted TIM-barrel fold metal-dependent hydrolase